MPLTAISKGYRAIKNTASWLRINFQHLGLRKGMLAERDQRPTVLIALAEPGHPYYESWRAGIEANGWRVMWLQRTWTLLFSHQLFLYLALCRHVQVVHLIDVDLRNLFGYSNAVRRWMSFATLRLIVGWPKLLGKRVVYSFGNFVPHEDSSPVEYKRHHLICSLVHDVISLSPSQTRELTQSGISERHIWPAEHADIKDYFLVPEDWQPVREKMGIPPDALVLLCIGSIRPYKGIEVAIEGVKRSKNPQIRLLIAGRPSAGYEAEDIVRLTADDERIIPGPLRHLSNAEMGWMFQGSDYCLLPYMDIGHSGLVCQSLGLGVPVIASRVGCLPDYLDGGAGLLFTPGDPDDLAHLLDNALGQFDYERARAASLRIMGLRPPERIGSRLVSIYAYSNGSPSPETEWLF